MGGISTSNTLKIKRILSGCDVLVSLDNGNLHSLLDISAAKGVRTQVVNNKQLMVMVANVLRITSSVACSDVS